VADGDTARWSGAVWLDRDFHVASGGTLIIEPGTRITAQSGVDRENHGNQLYAVELVVDGQVLMNGTESQRVTLTSTGQYPGDWGGILFRDSPDVRVSMLAYPAIDYALIGVQVDTLACDLIHPRFAGSALPGYTNPPPREIYLDRDTRIAEGHEWNLDAPVRVTMAPQDLYETGGADIDRVEITVDGALRTQRPTGMPSTDRVVFAPASQDSLNGDDWYGITIRGDGFAGDGLGVGHIKDAEIAFAKYPLTFWAADTAEVTNSWFHHYHDEAIVDFASDAAIVGNTIWRGLGLDASDPTHHPVGRVGIHLASTFGPDSLNVVFHQMERGIWADFTSGSCSDPSTQDPARTLTLR